MSRQPLPWFHVFTHQPWPALSSILWTCQLCALWSCISLGFYPAPFFGLLLHSGLLGYSHFPEQTQRKRQELHDKAPSLLTCICISFFSSLSAPSLSLSLPVCMSFVSSIQYTEMSSLLSEIVWAVLPSLWTVGFHCDILCDMVLPSTNSIGVRDTGSTRSTSLEQLQCGMKTLPFLLSMPT